MSDSRGAALMISPGIPWAVGLRRLVASIQLISLSAAVPAFALTPTEQRIVAEVNAQHDAFGTDLERAVQIDSATENLAGVRQLGEFFARQLAELGFDSH